MTLGFGVALFSIIILGNGLISIIFDGYIELLYPINGLTELPFTFINTILLFLKSLFIFSFGIGLVAFGLFYGLRSDVMYLPAMGGLLMGVIGNLLISLYYSSYSAV
jgi:hypothetical protein